MKSIIKRLCYFLKKKTIIPVPVQSNTTELLKGKIALVVGGTGGIGEAICETFIQNGCKVIVAGTNEKKMKEICSKIDSSGENARYLQIDLIDVDSMEGKINQAINLYEEKKIDILVNSAGILNSLNFFNMSVSEYDSIMDINLRGVYFLCQVVSKYMINNNIHGHILNVSSSSSLRPAWTPYQLSKWGLKGFTEGLADLLIPYGIVVNSIAPGPVATQMLGKNEGDDIGMDSCPAGRMALPNEIANLAVLMVSSFGDMIVGDTYYITGGCGTIRRHF